MASDPIDTVLDELATWAEQTERAVGGDSDEADMLLRLLRDHLDVEHPGDLAPGTLEALLLKVYPRKVTVLDPADTSDVIPTIRDLLAFFADTGRVPATRVTELEREVDSVEPKFLEAVMDPSNWGMARSFTQAMAEDGIDFSNQDAVNRWIASYNANLPGTPFDDPPGLGSGDEPDFGDVTFDLKEMLGLPDRLPALRLPPENELAALARESALLVRAKQLALWVGQGRPAEDGELGVADTVAAAQAVGIDVPRAPTDADALPEMPTPPAVRGMADIPELLQLWEFAEGANFLELDATSVTMAPDVEDWPDGVDGDVLDTWECAFADTLSRFLVLTADLDSREDIDFGGAGGAMAVTLFLAGDDGLRLEELNELVKECATADLDSGEAEAAWRSWVDAHGAPADALLARLDELGAAQVSDGVARLSPLAKHAVRSQLVGSDVEVPLLPPVEDMTAADLVEVGTFGTEDELAAESEAWLKLRSPEAAVAELLAVATAAEPTQRMVAASIAGGIGAAGEWRRALDEPALRPYAKIALTQIAGAQPDEATAGLEPTVADLAWLLTDTIAGMVDSVEPDELAASLRDAVPGDRVEEMFGTMWRLDHPYVHDVLTLLGKHHPDKKVAKAARKAAFKVAPPTKRPQRR